MAEDGNGFNCENGSSKNQTSTNEKMRRASKEANHVWASLKRRKAPRGNPEAAALKPWSVSEASSSKSRRTNATIAENAAKELSPSLYTCQMCPIVMQERLHYECTT